MQEARAQVHKEVQEYVRTRTYYPLPLLQDIEKIARTDKVPIIPPEVGFLLHTLVRLKRPAKILEIGCATGYSALWMLSGSEEAQFVGVERDRRRFEDLSINLDAAHYSSRASIFNLDALSPKGMEQIRTLAPYDFIFIDCEKRLYKDLWNVCTPHLSAGGTLIADNVLFQGRVAAQEVDDFYRRGVESLREFIAVAQADPDFISSILPLGDGVLLAIRH